MKYEYGDVGFVYNGALISKIMRFVMGSKWSHSFMVIGELNGEIMIQETSDFEVTISGLDKYLDGRPCEIYRVNQSIKLLPTMWMQGLGYGYSQLISLGLRRLLYKIVKLPNFFQRGIICCQIPMYAYKEHFGFHYKSLDTEEFYQLVKKDMECIYVENKEIS